MNKELKEPYYTAEVGTPLQKVLVDNFEAQKQLKDLIDKTVQHERERIVGLIEKFESEPLLMTTTEFPCDCDFENGDIIHLDEKGKHTKCGQHLNMPVPIKTPIQKLKESLITNKSDINKDKE